MYATAYQIGTTLSKRDKLGIHSEIEKIILAVLQLTTRACFCAKIQKEQKINYLKEIRISLEVLKQFIRTEYELHIITEKTYLMFVAVIIASSKETNNWLASLIKPRTQNPTLYWGLSC